MKDIKHALLTVLSSAIAILLLPIILCGLLCIVLLWLIRYPFCNAKYKKSHYFKDFGISIAAFVYDSEFYAIYNAVREANLPLTPVLCRDHKNRVIDLLFFHGDNLLCVDGIGELEYDSKQGKWESTNDDGADYIDYMKETTDFYLTAHPECPLPARRVILVERSAFEAADLPRAMETPEFLVYDKKDPAKAIREWISQTEL